VTSLHELSNVAATAVAVDDGERTLTWAELDDRSIRLGNGVEALGAVPGSHVAVCVGNRTEFVEAVIGSWRAGCAYTPVKTGWTAAESGALFDDAHTRVLITDRAAARDAAAERGIAVVDLTDGYEAWLAAQSDEPLTGDRFGFKLTYTSGTSGAPKGVVLSGSGTTPFDAGWAGIAKWASVLHLTGDGTHLFVSRLFNGAPQTFGFGALALGATLRIMRQWSPQAALDALADPAVTSTIMVPTMFRQLLALPGIDRSQTPAPGLRAIVHGGEPCPAPLKEAIADWFGDILTEYYGFSEGGMSVVNPGEWRSRVGTVGRTLPGMMVDIRDDTGAVVGPRTEGTVYFTSAAGPRFAYQGAADKTAQAYVGDSFTAGDIGWLDEDGFLYLCGRKADVVVSAGVNVYPAEIEQALCDVDGIADLCAVGAPDDDRGEVVALFVSLLPGVDPAAALAAVDARSAERLAPYKRPRETTVIAEIPRDGTGKLLRRALRDPLWEGKAHFAADTPPGARGGR
jgi:long-chain acyl-CoA synthetase